jgi:TPR repeat protein
MDNVNTPNININNSLFKVNLLEIEPTTRDIEENIFEEDLSILVDKLVNLYLQEVNKGNNEKLRKKFVLDYFDNYKINLQEIRYWILNNQNYSNSIYLLGYFNYHGIGINVNIQNAFKLYQKAADLENILAQFELSCMYLFGRGVDKNYNKAFELSEKLSERKYSFGVNSLGYCYEYGVGINTNREKAFELYQRAADLGNISGIFNLGRCYKNGFGTDVNKEKAFESFQKAANFGYSMAQQYIAWMYEKGYGTEKNKDLAIYWYKKSTEQGSTYAKNKLKQLLKE